MAQLILNLKKLAEEAVDAELKRRDLVDVVRCKDCKWSEPYRTESGNVYLGCIELGISALIDSDYCSYGERKEKTNEDNRR